MNHLLKGTALTALAGMGLAGSAEAAKIDVNADIAVSTTWTADNTYDLKAQIYVLPGATLTIEPGTVIASTSTVNGSGSLAITRGAQIIAKGTATNPIIFTSLNDVATWTPDAGHPTGGDPTTGTWREAANEWGNITLMGRGFIAEDATAGNVPTCNASNVGSMEGLTAGFPGDTKVLYGGGDDTDDSGTLQYVNLRYGGRVVGLANELNGLSLGGIGSDTDIDHIEIMNNVDDGIEIWGGCVNLKYFSIWNIGDDSLDVDQGWRGKAQFGLIVQGYSQDASQGSGVGDNAIETDGAENSDWQPVTTTTMYNMTVIGQPVDGDGLTAWRDNARVQYRNSIFMDCGELVVRFDNLDGDGAQGYGHNGTLDWPTTWTTAYNAVPATPNDCPPGTYKAQTSGRLIEFTDNVFWNNLNPNAYTEANARGVFDAANNNVVASASPITSITRATPTIKGGKIMQRVTGLNPLPQNDALTPVGYASGDDFFSPVKVRGAFAPGLNWLENWATSWAFGFTSTGTEQWADIGCALEGQNGWPILYGEGPLSASSNNSITLTNARANAIGGVFLAVFNPSNIPFKGGTLKALNPVAPEPLTVLNLGPTGSISFPVAWPASGIPAGVPFFVQWAIQDAAAINGVALSNALQGTSN